MADAPLSATRPDAAPLGGSYTPPSAPAPDPLLERALRNEPTAFSFFQAVRLLSRLRPDRAPVGGWADPASETVRFSAARHSRLQFEQQFQRDLEELEERIGQSWHRVEVE